MDTSAKTSTPLGLSELCKSWDRKIVIARESDFVMGLLF